MPYIILKPFVNVCPTLKRGGSYAFWEKERGPCAHLGCLRVERRQQGLMEDKKYVEKCLEEKSRMRGDGGQLRGLKCIFWHVSELLRKEKLMKTRPLGRSLSLHSLSIQCKPQGQENLGAFLSELIWKILDT